MKGADVLFLVVAWAGLSETLFFIILPYHNPWVYEDVLWHSTIRLLFYMPYSMSLNKKTDYSPWVMKSSKGTGPLLARQIKISIRMKVFTSLVCLQQKGYKAKNEDAL